MNEQEKKFKDGEATITTLQVDVLHSFAQKLIGFHNFYPYFILNFLKLNLINTTILAKFLKL